MEYEGYELKLILFDNNEVFTVLEFASDNNGDEGGTSLHSVGPTYSDM